MTSSRVYAAGRSFSDVEYSRVGGQSLRLDAYVPASEDPVPAVIIVHGGAWVTGDRKHSVEPLFKPLAAAGFAWFSISYRLANTADPAGLAAMAGSTALLGNAVEDVRAAVAYVRKHAAEYRIDPNRIALVGESAGAQLAAMAALKPGPGQDVSAVVALYCPSDLVSLVQNTAMIPDSIRQAVRGTAFADILMTHLRELSPLYWVHKGAPPFLLIHGTADRLVPFRQSVQFCSALENAGSACQLVPIEGAGHGLRWWESDGHSKLYKIEMVHWLSRQLSMPLAD
ncbi:MAG TPA: alpha/beta hydrolase [Bryobacteraceae bacterium]|nr:alpha/beta hydrolase [Bryobacteraceae bacterium]